MEKTLSPACYHTLPPPSLSNILSSRRKVNSGEIPRCIECLVAKQVRECSVYIPIPANKRATSILPGNLWTFVSLALKMLEGRNLDEVFGKLERVWEKRVGPLNKGRFSMFRGLRIIVNKTLQIRFYSPFPKKSLKIAVKTPPPRCDIACPPPQTNRWYAV